MAETALVKELRDQAASETKSVENESPFEARKKRAEWRAAAKIERLEAERAEMLEALWGTRSLVAEAAMTGFMPLEGDWAERLFANQAVLSAVLASATESIAPREKERKMALTTASAALRAAVHDALGADTALTALLGGPKVYDEPPRDAVFPYVTIGETRSVPALGSNAAEEHDLALHAWSRQGGHREAHLIAGALLQALDDAPLTLTDHHLINFRFAVADVRREADGHTYRTVVRFRAVTEPA